jgi:hypothetical protein
LRNRQFHCPLISFLCCSGLVWRVWVHCLGPAGDNIRHLGQTQELILHSARQIFVPGQSLSNPAKINKTIQQNNSMRIVAIVNSCKAWPMLQSPSQPTEHTTLFLSADLCRKPFRFSSQSGSPSAPCGAAQRASNPTTTPLSCSSASAGVHGMAWRRARLVVVVGLPGATVVGETLSPF